MSAQLSTPPSSNERSSEKSISSKSSRRKFFSTLLHRKSRNDSSSLLVKKGINSRSSSSSNQIGSSPSFSRMKNKSKTSDIVKIRSRSQGRGRSKGPDRSEASLDDDDSVFNYAEDDKDEHDTSNNFSEMSSSSSSFSANMSSPSLSDDLGGMFKNSQTNINEMLDLTTSDIHQPWDGLTPECLVLPKYVKTHRRNKHSPKSLNNLFLAQELNVESCFSKNNGDNDSISSESLKQETSSDEEQDDILYEHEVEMKEFYADSQGYSKKPAHKRQNKNDQNEVYVMEFSKDGKYLAVAGRNAVIKIWKVISSPLGRLEQNNIESELRTARQKKKSNNKLYQGAPVFHQAPVKIFKGHNHSILSLDWSKNNFLISGSMDRLVKLWHVDRSNCLGTFQNDDFVTTVKFHPTDDRFFLSGSLDNQVRLWSILDKSIAYSRDLGDDILITAASFTPDGQHCIVGGFNGYIFALEVNGLHVINKIEVKEKSFVHSFHNRNGNKITGIKVYENNEFPNLHVNDEDPLAKWSFLITTNDSKIRLINSDLRKLVTRFKGLTNNSSSIVASTTDNLNYIISGSEDHWCYIWENNNSIINNKLKLALQDLVLEGKSHINDLLSKHKSDSNLIHKNPLMKKLNIQKFLDDEDNMQYVANENNSYVAFHPHHSKVNVAIFAPESTKKLLELSDDVIFDLIKRGEKHNLLGRENSDNFKQDLSDEISNSIGLGDGNIIVTTDQYGLIRVFRQDSAYEIRKRLRELLKLKKDCSVNSKIKYDGKMSPNNQLLSSRANSKNSLKIELPRNPYTRNLLAQNRSISPSHEGYFTLKNKLHNKIKGSNNGSASNTNNSSSIISGNSSGLYQSSNSKSSSHTNLPRFVSSSSLVNGGIRHNKQSSSGIMPQLDATVDIQNDYIANRNMSESPYIPETGNSIVKAPGSAYTLTLSQSNDNRSTSTLTAPVSSTNTGENSNADNSKVIPLLISTRSTIDNESHEPELIDFHTPINAHNDRDKEFEDATNANMSEFNKGNNSRGRI